MANMHTGRASSKSAPSSAHLRAAFIPDKDLRKLIGQFPNLIVTHARRHFKVYNPITQDFVIAPVTGSDWRGLRNLRGELERLSASGQGYMARAAEKRAH
jgi:hypothetical protein